MSSKAKEAPFKVAIVGGGISGLTLALGLLERNIPFTVYEQSHQFKEIGAGVAFTPNAVKSMEKCSSVVKAAYDKVATGNGWASKKDTYFDFGDGYSNPSQIEEMFTLKRGTERPMVYRAHFLDYLVKHLPKENTVLGKRVDSIEEGENGEVTLKFHDNSTAKADVVIGCDGIKSQVRKAIVGPDHPSIKPVYSGVYAYRGLIPAEKAKAVIGEDYTLNSKFTLGKGGHFVTFPVANHTYLNVVAFVHDKGYWDHPKFTRVANRIEAEKDYSDWSLPVRQLVSLLEPELEVWGIFDSLGSPLPQYNNGRVCVLGDAAHASTPHMGSGAGMGVEDCAILLELLNDASISAAARKGGKTELYKALEAAFAAFDIVRRERSQWLVESSRRCGDMFDWCIHPYGPDRNEELKKELNWRHHKVWNVDIDKLLKEAIEELGKQLAASS